MRAMLLSAVVACLVSATPAEATHLRGKSHSITGFVGNAHVHHHPGYFPPRPVWGFRYVKGGRCHHYHYYKPYHRDC